VLESAILWLHSVTEKTRIARAKGKLADFFMRRQIVHSLAFSYVCAIDHYRQDRPGLRLDPLPVKCMCPFCDEATQYTMRQSSLDHHWRTYVIKDSAECASKTRVQGLSRRWRARGKKAVFVPVWRFRGSFPRFSTLRCSASGVQTRHESFLELRFYGFALTIS